MQFSGSRALSDAFALGKSRFGPLFAVAVLYYVLLGAIFALFGTGLMTQAMAAGRGAAAPAEIGIGMVVLYVAIYALGFFQQSASVRLCSDRHAPALGEALSVGLRSVPTLFGVAVLAIVALIALMVVFSVVLAGIAAASQSAALSVILPFVLLGVFGYLGMRLSMILPVVANEDQRNPITAIARSWQLTRGSALKLFLLFTVVAIVMGAIGVAIFALTIGFSQAGAVPGVAGIAGFFIAMIVFGLTIGIYFVALVAAIHNQLAGPAVDEMRETFA